MNTTRPIPDVTTPRDLPPGPSGRLEFVDSLRGFALLGVFWANLLIFSGIAYMTDEQRSALLVSPFDRAVYSFELFFIENKFMGLFSILFGISFWLFLRNVGSRGSPAIGLFYRRVFWLLMIGLVHGWIFWAFDILRFYALWALVLPLFINFAPRRLLVAGLVAGVLMPAVVAGFKSWLTISGSSSEDVDALAMTAFASGSFLDVLSANWKYDWHLTVSIGQVAYQVAILGRFLIGLSIARAMDLENLRIHRRLLVRVLAAGGAVGLVGSIIFTGELLTPSAGTFFAAFVRRFLVEGGQLGLTLAYASALALLFLKARTLRVVTMFAPIGRMALSAYLLQTAIGIAIFYGYPRGPALFGQLPTTELAILCIAGFSLQAGLARLWLRRFRFGPAEWLWRSLTYAKVQSIRKG